MKETLLYGVRTGNEDWEEELLTTQGDRIEEVKRLAAKDGFNRFRVATWEPTTGEQILNAFRKAVKP